MMQVEDQYVQPRYWKPRLGAERGVEKDSGVSRSREMRVDMRIEDMEGPGRRRPVNQDIAAWERSSRRVGIGALGGGGAG